MLDNLKISLHINNWKQHVQLQLMSIQKYIIGKINAIVRLKKRHANIKFKIFISKNYKTLESFIVSLTGYEIIDIANAFASSSFMLILVKIGFFCLFSYQISFIFNLLLLISFFGLSLLLNVNFYIRFGMYKIIKKTLGDYFFGILSNTWYNARNSIFANPGMFYGSFHYSPPPIKWPISSLGNFIAISFFTLLIQFRLFMLSEPFLFFFGRFIVFYWLIFNKYLILTYFISLIVLVGRYILLYQHNDMKSLKEALTSVFVLGGPIKTIKPTYKNAFYILSSITSNILMDYPEKLHFYRTKKDPKNKFIEKYLYHTTNENIGDTSIVWCKLQNYFSNVDFEQDMQLEQTKRNKNILKILSFAFIFTFIYIYIYFSSFHPADLTIFDNFFFEIKSFEPFFLIFKLPTEKMWDFYNILNYKNLFTNHPGLFFIKFNETTKNLDIYMSNFTTVSYYKPNLNLNFIGAEQKYAYVKTIPKGILTGDGLNFLQKYGKDVTKEFNNKNLLDGATFYDAEYVNKLRENETFATKHDNYLNCGATPFKHFQFFYDNSLLELRTAFISESEYKIYIAGRKQFMQNVINNKFNTGAAKVHAIKTKTFQDHLQETNVGRYNIVSQSQSSTNNVISAAILHHDKFNSHYSDSWPIADTLKKANLNSKLITPVHSNSLPIQRTNIVPLPLMDTHINERFGDVFDNDSN